MRCRKCESAVSENWSYCPSCGLRVPPRNAGIRDFFNIGLEDIFDRFVSRSMDDMIRNFAEAHQGFDNPGEFRDRGSKGITVRIVQRSNKPSEIEINRIEPNHINVGQGRRSAERGIPEYDEPLHPVKEIPSSIVEPKIEIVRLPKKTVIECELPDVLSEKDVNVLKMEESLEIRASAKDKLYLKIVQLPKRTRIISKAFLDGRLKVEIGK